MSGVQASRRLHFDIVKNTESGKPVAEVDSWRINAPMRSMLIDGILDDVAAGCGGTVFTLNLDHLAKLRRDAAFREAYRRARWVSADGMPVVMLARAGGAEIERVTGADLVEPLSAAAAAAKVPVYFFGSSEEVLAGAVASLRETIPDLVVAGASAPPMGFDPHGPAAAEAARRIAQSGAGICFVALGAPKQEFFADVAAQISGGVTYLGVGAALDFLAGRRRRAPRILQACGLEWAWRAAQEPRRLIPRYLDSGLWLIRHVVHLALHGGASPAPTRSPARPGDHD